MPEAFWLHRENTFSSSTDLPHLFMKGYGSTIFNQTYSKKAFATLMFRKGAVQELTTEQTHRIA